jgi:hypothetical protein
VHRDHAPSRNLGNTDQGLGPRTDPDPDRGKNLDPDHRKDRGLSTGLPPVESVPPPRTPAGDTISGARVDSRKPGPRAWDFTATVAVGVYLVGAVVALLLPHAFAFNYTGAKSWSAPLGVGAVGGAVAIAVTVWRRHAPQWLAGAGAGFLGAWVTLMLGTAMRGTPFPFQGLQGDAAGLTQLATRYSVSWATVDATIPGLPSEYPPLFPWVVGRVSVLIDQPAWRLVGQFEMITTGLAILVGFLMWRRLVPAWVALTAVVFGFLFNPDAAKAYEVVSLTVFIPWVLATFGRPPRGRLHWLTAGVIGGLIVLTYYGWIIFGVFAILGIAFATWRAETDRWAYLRYLGKVVLTAAVVASWFVVPFAVKSLAMGGESVSDLYGSTSLLDDMFPFVGTTPFALLQLTGLVGLVFFLRSRWWAAPLATIVGGAYLFRAVGAMAFALTQHTWMAHYTPRLYGTALSIAGVLTLVDAVPKLLARLSISAPRGGVVIATSIALAWAGYTYMMGWMPNLQGPYAGYTERAYLEPLPDGAYLIDMRNRTPTPWFPVTPIQSDVERVLGKNPNAVVLSTDGRLFAFLPWHAYTGNDLGGSLARTYERLGQLRDIAGRADPASFAAASAHTAYGPIDVFVLHAKDGAWQWTSHMGFGQPDAVVSFQPSVFDAGHWVIDTGLPNDYVVAIRRPGSP